MNPNELHANISALLNGDDPATGDPVDFDDSLTIVAEVVDEDPMVGALSDGTPQRFTVTGWKVVEGRLVLELSEDVNEEPPGDVGDLLAGQPDIPPVPPKDDDDRIPF